MTCSCQRNPSTPSLMSASPPERLMRHFEESGVHQFHPAFLGPLLDLLNARGLEIHYGDHVVAFGEHELVSGIVTHAVQMIQIAIGAVYAFIGEVGQPPATCGMKVGHDETFQGRGFRRWFGGVAGEERNAAGRGAGHSCQKVSPIYGFFKRICHDYASWEYQAIREIRWDNLTPLPASPLHE